MPTSRLCRAAFGVALVGLLGAGQARADAWLEAPSTGCTALAQDENAASWTIAWSGSCVEGKASGHGILVTSDGKGLLGVYEGETADGKLQGEGDLRFRDDETVGWDRYTGDLVSSKAEGESLLTTNEGWEYEWEFKDGEEDGESGRPYCVPGDQLRKLDCSVADFRKKLAAGGRGSRDWLQTVSKPTTA